MAETSAELHGFAYGELVEGPEHRSLGYRLLEPTEGRAWLAEIEALARGLQAAPYPEHWPPAELFCSVLLADGERLVALARYGLADHTASRRRGGLELIGVVGPGSLGVASALAIYCWLQKRRDTTEDIRTLAGEQPLAEVLAASPPQVPQREAVSILPIRIWHEGALLFAATAPSDPDRRLGLLEDGTSGNWQWLPLVGPDFPVATYAERGPLVAWTPHLAGVAVKLDRPGESRPIKPRRVVAVGAALIMVILLAANLWATLSLPKRIATTPNPTTSAGEKTTPIGPTSSALTSAVKEPGRDHLAEGIYHVLQKRGSLKGWSDAQLLKQYDGIAAEDDRLRAASKEAKLGLGGVSMLARRSPAQVEATVRDALSNKGYDPALVDRACQLVREKMAEKK